MVLYTRHKTDSLGTAHLTKELARERQHTQSLRVEEGEVSQDNVKAQ